MDNEAFRQYGYKWIDWIADYLSDVENFPVCSQVKPGEIKAKLPEEAPVKGESMEAIFKDFKDIILPGISHWQHPSWFAYFPAHNSPPSILAELVSAGLGIVGLAWQTSPSAAELEEVVMEWLRKMLGLPEGMTGVIQDTASAASLVALLTAREKATDYMTNIKGLSLPITAYISEESHSSIEKGAKVAGYGKEYIRRIPTDEHFAMLPEKLEEAVCTDKEKGLQPACVVATVGTTSSSAVDPLVPIGDICCKYNLWLHVDAAYAGSAFILPEKAWLLQGVENADSLVFNPHKWLLTNMDCSAFFVRDPEALIRTFDIRPEYLKTAVDSQVKNYRDWGIPLGRRFRALKLWFVLRSYGLENIQEILRNHIRWAGMFKDWVERNEFFELMAPVPLSLVCFRLNDDMGDEAALTALNEDLLERINSSGKVFLTHTVLKGKYVLRMAIGTRTTQEQHVRQAWELIKKEADAILGLRRTIK